MRFSEPITAFSETSAMDSMGNAALVRSDGKLLWANVYTVGTSAWLAGRAAGLHADAEVQVRSIDYGGENVVVMGGEEYSVERASNTGEFTRLVLSHRLANGKGGSGR